MGMDSVTVQLSGFAIPEVNVLARGTLVKWWQEMCTYFINESLVCISGQLLVSFK